MRTHRRALLYSDIGHCQDTRPERDLPNRCYQGAMRDQLRNIWYLADSMSRGYTVRDKGPASRNRWGAYIVRSQLQRKV